MQTDDIHRQLVQSNAKAIFTTPKIFSTIKQAVEKTNEDIKIICIKTDANDSIPSGSIDLAELINTTSEGFALLNSDFSDCVQSCSNNKLSTHNRFDCRRRFQFAEIEFTPSG